jgi:hypothetical protein
VWKLLPDGGAGRVEGLSGIRAIAGGPNESLVVASFDSPVVDVRASQGGTVELLADGTARRAGFPALQGATAVRPTFFGGPSQSTLVLGVMADGTIQQWDTPYRVYHQPRNRFVADFVGQGVFLPGIVIGERSVEVELGLLQSRLPLECSQGCEACGKGCGVEVLLRPDDIIHDDHGEMLAEVRHKAFRGAEILYTLRLLSGVEVLSLVPSHHNHAIGEKIGIRLDVDHVVAFKTANRGFPATVQPIQFHR